MKTILFTILVIASITVHAQAIKEKKVAIIPNLVPQEINVLEANLESQLGYCLTPAAILSCSAHGVKITTNNLPFKVYDIPTDNLNIQQDIYNRIVSHVPGVQITNTNLNETPRITMRGDSNTIYIIDGIRFFDASILNTINANDIESIKVSLNPLAQDFLLFNSN
jgi:hypothetical protein